MPQFIVIVLSGSCNRIIFQHFKFYLDNKGDEIYVSKVGLPFGPKAAQQKHQSICHVRKPVRFFPSTILGYFSIAP